MPRLGHGKVVALENLHLTAAALARSSVEHTLASALPAPVDLKRFDYLFPNLQADPSKLLPTARKTRTCLGQSIDHDLTLEAVSASLPDLVDPALTPMTVADVQGKLRNARTAALDLDSVYAAPAPRSGELLRPGRVSPAGNRPPRKVDESDLPREPASADLEHDRAALTGDPRNDENLIISQLHVAFLKAHNALVASETAFDEARTTLIQHYRHVVLHDFLKRIVDPAVVDRLVAPGHQVFDAGTFALPDLRRFAGVL